MQRRVLKIAGRIAKWVGIALISIILLLVILVFTIRTPWAQQQLISKITEYVSGKTGTAVEIKKLFITFRGDVQLEGVYLEDLEKDTMLYIGNLEAGVAFLPLISGDIHVNRINLQGLVADIQRDKDSTYNFDFLIDAFTSAAAEDDTTVKKDKALPHIKLGPVDFLDFRASYHDEIAGIQAKLALGSLNMLAKSIDLNILEIKVDELALMNVNANATRWRTGSVTSDNDTAIGTLPFISCNTISLKNINLSYIDSVESIQTYLDLDTFGITNAEFDGLRKVINAGDITLLNASAKIELPEVESSTEGTASAKPFVWPRWKIKLNKVEIAGTDIEMKRANIVSTPGQFNANDMRAEALQLQLENVVLDPGKAELELKNLAFHEQCGFELNRLALDIKLDVKKAQVKKLELTTPNNFIDAEITMSYVALDSLISNPLTSHVDLDIKQADLSLLDAYFFAPQLKTDTQIQTVAAYPINLSGAVSGTMKDLDISDLNISALHSFDLALSGNIKGLPDTNAIRVDIPALSVSLTKRDLMLFIDSLPNAAMLPDTINLQAKLDGSARDLLADLSVKTNRGNVKLDARLENIFSVPAADGKLILENIDAGTMAAIPDLQPVSLTMDFKGKGKTIEQLTLDAQLNFSKLNFRNYDYSNLKLSIAAADKKAEIILQHTDKNLDIELLAIALLDTLNPEAQLQVHLRGADLRALGITPENVKIGAEIQANWKGLPADFNASLAVTKGTIIKESEAHYLRPITMSLSNSIDSTALEISSEILNGKLEANHSIDTIIGSLTNYLQRLASTDSLRTGLMNDSLVVSAHFTVNNSRLLNGVLFPQLTRMDSIRLDLEFHPLNNKLDFNLSAPKIVYADILVDSLGLFVSADAEDMEGVLYFRQVKTGPVNIHRTKATMDFKDKIANVLLTINDSTGKPVADIATNIDLRTDSKTLVKIIPEGLLLNGEPWSIPADNSVAFTKSGMLFRSMELTGGGQRLGIENAPAENEENIKASFSNFELSSFSTILSTADSLLSGTLNGTIELQQIKTNPGIEADVSLDHLTVIGNPIGTLKLNANNKIRDQYAIDLALEGPSIDLKAKGTLFSSTSSLDMKADLSRLDMKLAEGFTSGKLKESSGSIEGHCTVTGPLSDVQYKGYLLFNRASFVVRALNTRFTLPDDRAEISDDGIVFKNFDVADANGRNITVNGNIDTRNMLDPTFDLSIVTDNFQPLNSTRDDNDLFYGKAFIDTDVKITGTLNLPVVVAKARLRKGTDITFIVPETEAAIEERKGLVSFKNMKDTLTSTILIPEEKEEVNRITGIDLTSYIEVDRETSFSIVIDERSGDQIHIEGEAKLNLEITPNGIMTLSGNYEIADGSYNMNFYGLAKRKFELVPGSKISWSGDPLSGQLDLTALYNVKASAVDLMTDQLARSDESAQAQYRQVLPFKVVLNIDGELLKPEISFALDMPESSRLALGGNVYKRIKQLNESQAELDQQVFSLIVLNRFLPAFDGGSGNNDASEKIVRSSVSKLLSGQLNAYSAKYLKGFEVNLDVQSYTGYQTGSGARTDLDLSVRKSLFNERVVVQVGSQVALEGSDKSYQANDIIGDLSLEYLLTKEGQYRLKAFRKNQFQDLVEGQVIVTGLSVLFSKDFNAFKQLFEKIPKIEKEEEEKGEAPQEEKEKEEEETK